MAAMRYSRDVVVRFGRRLFALAAIIAGFITIFLLNSPKFADKTSLPQEGFAHADATSCTTSCGDSSCSGGSDGCGCGDSGCGDGGGCGCDGSGCGCK